MAFAVLREMKASLWDSANIRANNRGDENTPGGGSGGGGGEGGGDYAVHDKISDSLIKAQAEITRLRSEKVSSIEDGQQQKEKWPFSQSDCQGIDCLFVSVDEADGFRTRTRTTGSEVERKVDGLERKGAQVAGAK